MKNQSRGTIHIFKMCGNVWSGVADFLFYCYLCRWSNSTSLFILVINLTGTKCEEVFKIS